MFKRGSHDMAPIGYSGPARTAALSWDKKMMILIGHRQRPTCPVLSDRRPSAAAR